MRLAINAMSVAPGGALSVLLGLLEAWRTACAEIVPTVFAYRTDTLAAVRNAGFGDRLVAIPLRSSRRAAWWQKTALPRALRDLNPDLLLTNNYLIPGAPCRQVVHHHTLWSVFAPGYWPYVRRGPRRLLLTLGARAALRRADANVFISGYVRSCAEALVPASAGRSHVIYNGLNADYISAARRLIDRGVPSGAPSSRTLSAIQAPSDYKDNDSLIAALADLVRQAPRHDWRLRVIGGGPGGRLEEVWAPWRRMAQGLGVSERVEFLGHKPLNVIAGVLQSSACLVFPSVFEGFGMPVLEAMAMGCPVVAVRATAMPEVCGDAAALVPPRSPHRIAAEVLRLCDDTGHRRAMVERGLIRACQFPWSRSAELLARLFRDLLASGPR